MLFKVPLSYPTIWKMMQDGTFPRAVAVGQANCWKENEINNWLANRPLRRFKNDRIKEDA
nr:AlpA family phage regulatory protein [Bradyrhizobium diazoefficiens]